MNTPISHSHDQAILFKIWAAELIYPTVQDIAARGS